MSIITLITDFGLADGYVGVMKGVILGIAPGVRLVDLSHAVAPQNVAQAAYILERSAPYFPAGTVHLAVVDPGVGSRRRALAVRTANAWYVGPDNGLFSAALAWPDSQAFALDRPEYWRPSPSRTFHGRDIFAPVAAHLARGVPPEALGRPITDALRLHRPQPLRQADGITGAVIYADHFGNLITNIPGEWVAAGPAAAAAAPGDWRVTVAGQEIGGVSQSYSDVAAGQLLALVSSGDTLEIAVRDGSAAAQLRAGVGETVRLRRGAQG